MCEGRIFMEPRSDSPKRSLTFLMDLKLEKLIPLISIALIPLLLFWRLVFAGEVLYWGLPLYQFYPWHTMVVEAIRSGYLPLWTDLLGNGTPLLANHQSAVFYPLNLIYFVMPVEQAMGYSVVLHLILAGLFAYAWGRTIGLTRFGSTVVGLSFMLSGFFVSRTQFVTIINGAAWLPLLFLLAERLIRRRTVLDAIWLALTFALQFLAGHAQLWFYSVWMVAIYVVIRTWAVRQEGAAENDPGLAGTWRQRGRIFALLAGALVLSLGLSALQLVPTAELALHSQRADGLDLDEAMTYSFWPWRLLTLASPDLFGSPASSDYWGYATYWEDAGYVGVLPLLLGLGVVLVWGGRWLVARVRIPSFARRRAGGRADSGIGAQKTDGGLQDVLIPFFLLLVLLSLVLAMGQNTPLYPLVFDYVPGFGAFRAPARFLLFYTFGISTLAGIGADRFRLTYRIQYVTRLTLAGAAAMLVASLVVGRMDLPIEPTFAPAVSYFALWLTLSAGILLMRPAGVGLSHGQAGQGERETYVPDPRVVRSPLSLRVWHVLVIGVVAVDLILFAAPLTPTIDPALYRTTTDAERVLLARADTDRLFATYEYDYRTKFNSYFDFSSWGPSDLAHWLSFREALVPNLNADSQSASVNNDEPLVVGRWRELMEALRAADWSNRLRLLRMMNVGYVLAESKPPGLSPVEDVSHLYRLSDPLSRAWVVARARVFSAPDDVLSELMDPTFQPTNEVLLESAHYRPAQAGNFRVESDARPTAQALLSPGTDPEVASVTTSLREEGNSRTIDLVVSQPGYLVLGYTYYPGWQATVDGQPTDLLGANYAFMALPIEAGEHQVTLRYRPASLKIGALISGLSVLAVIGIVAFRSSPKSGYRGK